MGTKIGTDKSCPLKTQDNEYPQNCLDTCEWNDGEGCAIWRIIKALDRGNYWLELLIKERDTE